MGGDEGRREVRGVHELSLPGVAGWGFAVPWRKVPGIAWVRCNRSREPTGRDSAIRSEKEAIKEVGVKNSKKDKQRRKESNAQEERRDTSRNITLRVPPDLYADIKRAAADEDRSINRQLRWWIKIMLNQHKDDPAGS